MADPRRPSAPTRDAAFDQMMSRILPRDAPKRAPERPVEPWDRPAPARKLSAWDHVANALSYPGAPGKMSQAPDVDLGPGYEPPALPARGPERIMPLDRPEVGLARPRPYGKGYVRHPEEPEPSPWEAHGQTDLRRDLGLRSPAVPRGSSGDVLRDIGIDPEGAAPRKGKGRPSAWDQLAPGGRPSSGA